MMPVSTRERARQLFFKGIRDFEFDTPDKACNTVAYWDGYYAARVQDRLGRILGDWLGYSLESTLRKATE